jgi:hypothetical protein
MLSDGQVPMSEDRLRSPYLRDIRKAGDFPYYVEGRGWVAEPSPPLPATPFVKGSPFEPVNGGLPMNS